MPANPYEGNDEAAEYICRRSSRKAIEEHAANLHTEGIERQRQALRRIENEMYPQQPRKVLTQQQVDAHVKEMVEDWVVKRHEDFRKVEAEMYGTFYHPVTGANVQKPIPLSEFEHMHKLAMHRKSLRDKKRTEHMKKYKKPERDPAVVEEEKKLERAFRPIVRVDPTKTDGAAYLVHDDPDKYHKVPTDGHQLKADDRTDYWTRLARPVRPHEKFTRAKSGQPRFVSNVKYGGVGK